MNSAGAHLLGLLVAVPLNAKTSPAQTSVKLLNKKEGRSWRAPAYQESDAILRLEDEFGAQLYTARRVSARDLAEAGVTD